MTNPGLSIWRVVSKYVCTQLVNARDATEAVEVAAGKMEGTILSEDEYCIERYVRPNEGNQN